MKIIDDRIRSQKFVELNVGDTFMFDKLPCLKIKELVPCDNYIHRINAIDLKSYKPLSIGDDFLVLTIKTELHILG